MVTPAPQELPPGFHDFYLPIHRQFAPSRLALLIKRDEVLAKAHQGELPEYQAPSDATTGDWRIRLPEWCRDQRNQMTGPADDAELVVKMLNSGAPGVMLDLEDSMSNVWSQVGLGVTNILRALDGTLTYDDAKRDRTVGIKESATVIFSRPRGLHLEQQGVIEHEATPASTLDVALIVYGMDPAKMKHPLCIYIPKSESAEEALWWRDLFQALARAKGLPDDAIKCMALVESHPLAFQMEQFLFNLRDHILGLNLGRWDYMASLIHFTLHDPKWVLPDRNTIPHDVPFFQNLRTLLPEICHKRGALAIGGMTALFPSRADPELNERALQALEADKKNEAEALMDGAWTGHPDQNEIAVRQFPSPNQINARPPHADPRPNLRPLPTDTGRRTVEGTRQAVRTVIRYRFGQLAGRGASLLDGYMEDLATERIYRLMLAQRMIHSHTVPIQDEHGTPQKHTPEMITGLFDQELKHILASLPEDTDAEIIARYRAARTDCESMLREYLPDSMR